MIRANKSRALTIAIAEEFGGEIVKCNINFTPLKTCRNCVKFIFNEMKVEVYIFYPFIEIIIQNFNIGKNLLFTFYKQNYFSGLTQKINNAFKNCRIPVYSSDIFDINELKKFCADIQNESNILSLKISKNESLTISDGQIVMRNKTEDINLLKERINIINSIFKRNVKTKLRQYSKTQHFIKLEQTISKISANDLNEINLNSYIAIEKSNPFCPNCNNPVLFIARIDMKDEKINAKDINNRYLNIVTCLSCCNSGRPLFTCYHNNKIEIINKGSEKYRLDFSYSIEKREITILEDSAKEVRGVKYGEPRHKIGGSPDWIHCEEIPTCPICKKSMEFIAQFETDDDVEIQFEDDGMLYSFICIQCKIIATFIQSK